MCRMLFDHPKQGAARAWFLIEGHTEVKNEHAKDGDEMCQKKKLVALFISFGCSLQAEL